MQKNTKILLGLGLIGLAYYLWNKSSKQITATSVIEPTKSSKPNIKGEYAVLEDFKSTLNGKTPTMPDKIIQFRKDEIIGAAIYPYDNQLYTTYDKKIPDFEMVGASLILVPKEKVELI